MESKVFVMQQRTSRSIAIVENTAESWCDRMPTYLAGGLLPVSEGVGTVDGSVFCFWIGDRDLKSCEVAEAVASFINDHDVVGLRFIRGDPEHVHRSLADEDSQRDKTASSIEASGRRHASDFLDGGSSILLYSKDGRQVSGTVEISYATGILRDLKRNADGVLVFNYVDDAIADKGDFATLLGEDRRPMYIAADGQMVPERDVVLVSSSRVDEFLTSIAPV